MKNSKTSIKQIRSSHHSPNKVNIKSIMTHAQQVANSSLTIQDCEFLLQKITNQQQSKIFVDYINKYNPKNSSSSIFFEKPRFDILPSIPQKSKKQSWEKQNERISSETLNRITKSKIYCKKHAPISIKQRHMLQNGQLYLFSQKQKAYRKKIGQIIKRANFQLNPMIRETKRMQRFTDYYKS